MHLKDIRTYGRPLIIQRRRYGNAAYTWIHAVTRDIRGPDLFAEDTVSLGDPWPCVTPKVTEVTAALEALGIPWTDARREAVTV